MQNELDRLYCAFMTAGFIHLRKASHAQNAGWLNSELELLHNVPSLIGRSEGAAHEYFWTKERVRYVEYVAKGGSDTQKSCMRTYYEPIWRDMEPLILALHQKA
jgi:hypothetical protein